MSQFNPTVLVTSCEYVPAGPRYATVLEVMLVMDGKEKRFVKLGALSHNTILYIYSMLFDIFFYFYFYHFNQEFRIQQQAGQGRSQHRLK